MNGLVVEMLLRIRLHRPTMRMRCSILMWINKRRLNNSAKQLSITSISKLLIGRMLLNLRLSIILMRLLILRFVPKLNLRMLVVML
ncbi:MAG: hypothetical protein B7Z80_16910 [Rhodospirillales bacterium 20-64-7]|nr:MAG: hypothetical protein B7Z80_16910 [Rhodospirillales bacterium 20-64-7]